MKSCQRDVKQLSKSCQFPELISYTDLTTDYTDRADLFGVSSRKSIRVISVIGGYCSVSGFNRICEMSPSFFNSASGASPFDVECSTILETRH